MVANTATWSEFEKADPDLAALVLARFESHRHGVLATLKADGSPRLSGMETPVRSGHLWLAMTPGSRKEADLARDPRFSLHSTPDSEDLRRGDARIDGAVSPADPDQQAEFIAGHRHRIDDPSMMVLFTALITRAVLVRVAGGMFLIESWTPTEGRTTKRHQ